ncbi:MAG: MOSC domain-containing protein, partial [Solirubrobacterales bacterium]|nr:MOSC domain-containing protein [Solirubrobacterales bacterium]
MPDLTCEDADHASGRDLALPVKSLAGERLGAVRVNPRGLEGDRLWALVDADGAIAAGKTTRRFRKVGGLLHHRSHLEHGQPVITLADGRAARADDPGLAGLVAAITPSGWSLRRENSTPYFDAAAVHVTTTTTLAALSQAIGEPVRVQRLRPNLLLDVQSSGRFLEDEWLGRTLRVGTVELRIVDRCERCVMVG